MFANAQSEESEPEEEDLPSDFLAGCFLAGFLSLSESDDDSSEEEEFDPEDSSCCCFKCSMNLLVFSKNLVLFSAPIASSSSSISDWDPKESSAVEDGIWSPSLLFSKDFLALSAQERITLSVRCSSLYKI